MGKTFSDLRPKPKEIKEETSFHSTNKTEEQLRKECLAYIKDTREKTKFSVKREVKKHGNEILEYLREERQERYYLIIREVVNGKSLKLIAKETNLSENRIHQIVETSYRRWLNHNSTEDFRVFDGGIIIRLKRLGLNNFEDIRNYVDNGGSLQKVKGIGPKREKEILSYL